MLRLVRGVVKMSAAGLLPAVVLLGISSPVSAEPIFFGPTPYLSAADSPFDLSGLGTTMFLEDFEDGQLNTPGIFLGTRNIFGRGFVVDSVDADDGIIDGQGNDGFSVGASVVCIDGDPGTCTSVIGYFFSDELGSFPTAAGMVWTDGSPEDALRYTIFDTSYQIKTSFGPFHLGDENAFGGTSEDRFLGVVDLDGIGGIAIEVTNARLDMEADHIQYGFFVPEPATILQGIIGAVLMLTNPVLLPRRRSTRGLPHATTHRTPGTPPASEH